jgi:hypothetical protein
MALWFLEPPSPEWDSGYRQRTLDVAKAFLAAGTPEEVKAAVAAARRIHVDVDGHGVPGADDLMHALDNFSCNLATAISGDWSLRCAAAHLRRDCAVVRAGLSAAYSALDSILKRRQIAAAEAILQDRDASLARPVEQDEIAAALADAAWMYGDGHLAPLVDLMGAAQQIRFKMAVMRQATALVTTARRASLETYERVYAVAREATKADALQAAREVGTLIPDHRCGWHTPPYDWEPPPLGTQWQIEAAWSILHDRDPPPLPETTPL